jgi:hypothetical protein
MALDVPRGLRKKAPVGEPEPRGSRKWAILGTPAPKPAIAPRDEGQALGGRSGVGEGARRCGRARVFFLRSLCAGVEAALPTRDALDHHGRDPREHGLGHRG